jgi:hypothetical protein
MKLGIIRIALAAATIGTLTTTALPQPAVADTTSTALIAAAAAAIIGTRRVYVNNNTASYYRSHNGRYQGPEGQMHGSKYHDDRGRRH